MGGARQRESAKMAPRSQPASGCVPNQMPALQAGALRPAKQRPSRGVWTLLHRLPQVSPGASSLGAFLGVHTALWFSWAPGLSFVKGIGVWSAHLSVACLKTWGAQSGVQTPCSFGRSCALVFHSHLGSLCPGEIDPRTVLQNRLPAWMWAFSPWSGV